MADDTMPDALPVWPAPINPDNIPIPNDILAYSANSMPANGVGFRDLRNMRGVSHFTLDIVDRLLGPGDLRTRLQARGTVYRQTLLNLHIQTDHRALASAMEDFLEDERLQLTILQSLDTFLINANARAFYSVPNPNQQPQTALIAIYRAVAQSLRRHHRDVAVMHVACAVLAHLPHLTGMSTFTDGLKTYIIETIACVAHDYPIQVQSMCYCITTVCKIGVHDVPPIMLGSHNLFNIMHRGLGNTNNIPEIAMILHYMDEACTGITASAVDNAQMAMVDMPTLQATLLRLAEESTRVSSARVVQSCLSIVARLTTLYPQRMIAQARTVTAAKMALIANMNDVHMTGTVIGVIFSIVRSTWDPSIGVPGTATARTTLEGKDIMLLTYTALYNQTANAAGAAVCVKLFQLLCMLCQNHAGHLVHAREYRMLQGLFTKFRPAAAGNLYHHWLDMHNRFETLLRTNPAPITAIPAPTTEI